MFAALLAAAVVAVVVLVAGLEQLVYDGMAFTEPSKAGIAAAALACIAWERRRGRAGRPVARRTARAVAVALGLGSLGMWYAGAVFSYSGFFHVWDQFHYVIGSKYFRELGYDGIYRCSAVALDRAGTVDMPGTLPGRPVPLDLRAEVRGPGYLIRDLGRGNVVVPAAGALADAGACTRRFSPARWASFQHDVVFFRLQVDAGHWQMMVRDHGYNPPPTWTAMGGAIAGLRPASKVWMLVLALLDPALVLAAFAALWWGFGWRTAALGAVFWGCQGFSPFFWTGGAFLRQDWFFFTILSVCLARRGRHAAAGASLAVAAALRVFPALLAIGWMVMLLDPRTRRRGRGAMLRTAAGGLAAAAVMLAAGAAVAGPKAYPAFVRHIRLHQQTPLTNEIGLRPLLAGGIDAGPSTGRLRRLRDERLPDPVQRWKEIRAERWQSRRLAAWAIALLLAVPFVAAVRRARRPWAAPGLSALWIVVTLQVTAYYYGFLAVTAPLARLRPRVEVWLLAFAVASQVAAAALWWHDERHLAFSALALAYVVAVNAAFARRRLGPTPLPMIPDQGVTSPAAGTL